MTSPANVGSFVVPGTAVDVNDDDSLGRGVIRASNGPVATVVGTCLLYTSPSPRDAHESRMPSSA